MGYFWGDPKTPHPAPPVTVAQQHRQASQDSLLKKKPKATSVVAMTPDDVSVGGRSISIGRTISIGRSYGTADPAGRSVSHRPAPELPTVPERIKAFESAGTAANADDDVAAAAGDAATLKAQREHSGDGDPNGGGGGEGAPYAPVAGDDEPEVKMMGGDHSDARLRQSTWQQISFNIFFYMFGASQIPFAMGQMGWYWGSGILVALTISSWISGHYLTDACERTFT
jgi:hypothetical protein